MNKDEVKHLAKKFLNGTASAAEKAALDIWYTSHLKEEEELVFTNEPEDSAAVKERLYRHIQQQLELNAGSPVRIKLWPKIAVAAALFLVAGMALYFYLNSRGLGQEVRLADAKTIAAGTNAAVLTLPDGKMVRLSSSKTGLIIHASALAYSDGDTLGGISGPDLKTARELTVSTPKGGQYQVVLPDGTGIWLNAGSVLKFPSAFDAAKARRVELTGEAYFEVAKAVNKAGRQAFVVRTGGQELEVLGTHFNINGYADESGIKTTLFEGSVRVYAGLKDGPPAKGREVLLRPGQQAVFSNQHIKVSPADPEEALAWRNGFFKFSSEPIPSVMRKLSRWYNVDVVYEGGPGKDPLSGTISRRRNIKEVLEMLEETKLVTFKVEGRKVIVR